MALEFTEKIAPPAALPDGGRLRARRRVRDARQQRGAVRPAARRDGGGTKSAADRQPLPGPVERAPAPGARRALRLPARPHRDRQWLLRHPAVRRRGAAGAGRRDRLLVAVVQRLPAHGGRDRRPRRRRPARRRGPLRPRRDARRDHCRHAAGDRLQPEQPDEHRAAARRDRAVREGRAAQRLRADRRGLLRVRHARRSRRLARPRAPLPERRPAADVQQGLRPRRPALRLRTVRRGGVPRRRRDRSASRSSATRSRRPPPRRRCATRTR